MPSICLNFYDKLYRDMFVTVENTQKSHGEDFITDDLPAKQKEVVEAVMCGDLSITVDENGNTKLVIGE